MEVEQMTTRYPSAQSNSISYSTTVNSLCSVRTNSRFVALRGMRTQDGRYKTTGGGARWLTDVS